jgi:hypothetical protein
MQKEKVETSSVFPALFGKYSTYLFASRLPPATTFWQKKQTSLPFLSHLHYYLEIIVQ